MDVIGHQAIARNACAGTRGVAGEKVQIETAVVGGEENRLTVRLTRFPLVPILGGFPTRRNFSVERSPGRGKMRLTLECCPMRNTQLSLLKLPGFAKPLVASPRLVPFEAKGVVYTKSWVVELLLDLANYRSDENLVDAVAVEPAAGDGAFLGPDDRAAYSVVPKAWPSVVRLRRIRWSRMNWTLPAPIAPALLRR
jgi:hypothetical protein